MNIFDFWYDNLTLLTLSTFFIIVIKLIYTKSLYIYNEKDYIKEKARLISALEYRVTYDHFRCMGFPEWTSDEIAEEKRKEVYNHIIQFGYDNSEKEI